MDTGQVSAGVFFVFLDMYILNLLPDSDCTHPRVERYMHMCIDIRRYMIMAV